MKKIRPNKLKPRQTLEFYSMNKIRPKESQIHLNWNAVELHKKLARSKSKLKDHKSASVAKHRCSFTNINCKKLEPWRCLTVSIMRPLMLIRPGIFKISQEIAPSTIVRIKLLFISSIRKTPPSLNQNRKLTASKCVRLHIRSFLPSTINIIPTIKRNNFTQLKIMRKTRWSIAYQEHVILSVRL